MATLKAFLLAALLKICHAQQGHAVFQASTLNLTEKVGTVGIPLKRVDGSTGILEATVTVDTMASTMQPVDYTFHSGSVRWTDGDTSPKALVISIHDDNTFEPTEVLELVISDTNPGSSALQRLKIYLQADDDGGQLEFTYVTAKGENTSLASSSISLMEGQPKTLQCIAWAERLGGSSGVSTMWLSVCEQEALATQGIDFDFYGANVPVKWEDGETDRRCVLYSLPSGGTRALLPYSWQSAIMIWPDADEEPLEELCFAVNSFSNSSASLSTGTLRYVLADNGATGKATRCFLGADCNVDFTGLHWEPGVNISLAMYCNVQACSTWRWPYAKSYRFTVPAEDIAKRDPGNWYACRCFEESAQAIHVISIMGPWSRNVASCTLGWESCSVQLTGEGLRMHSQTIRVLHACANIGDNSSDDDYIDAGLWKGGIARLDLTQKPGSWYNMADPLEMNSAGPGLFYMCWCFSGFGGRASCDKYSDFVVSAGLFVMEGPHVQEDRVIIHGSPLQFNVTGAGLEANDRISIVTSCNQRDVYMEIPTSDGYFFDFGTVHEGHLPPGNFEFCWCRRAGSLANCSHPDHWTYVGSLNVMCPSGYYNFEEECTICWWPWDVPNSRRDACTTDVNRVVGVVTMFIFTTLGAWLILCQLELQKRKGFWLVGRRIRIEDISPEGEDDERKLVLTTLGQHHLRNGSRFPLTFYGTNHFLLDNYTHRALVLDRFRLEISTENGEFFVADASGGHVLLSIPGTFWYTHLFQVFPVMLLILLLWLIGIAAVSFGDPPLLFAVIMACIQLSLAIMGRLYVWKRLQYRSPLDWRLQQYNAMLTEKNPTPVACQRGAMRAVTAFQLFDLYDFFQAFIKGRNMYYIDPNLVRPLTKRYRLSFAERAGPSQVDYFISHWWGTPFMNFCESVKRHAIHMSHSEDEGQWKKIAYWICTFSNNQYRVKEELGVTHQESSFYMALHSNRCKGTAMIMDEEASLLKRSWCLFELLQTVRKTQSEAARAAESGSLPKSPRFAGMFFCTKTGVLNYGHATVELAMKIGENIKNLSLENATATSQEDKDMINRLVLEEMGSYDKINHILRDNLAEALRRCQEEVDLNFETLFKDLKGEVRLDVTKSL